MSPQSHQETLRSTLRVTVSAFALLTLVACGGGSAASTAAGGSATSNASGVPTSPPAIAAYNGADREQVLETGAKKEGTLTWYTSLAGDILDSLKNGFQAKYPYLKMEVFRGDESEILTRATQENQANKPVFDAVESPPTTILVLSGGKLLAPYYSPIAAKLPDSLKTGGSNGLALSAADRASYIGFGYNTNLIPQNEAPKTLDDLMNPALSGKLTLAGSTTGNRWAGAILHSLGDDKGKKWLADFAAKQKPTVQQISGKAVFDLIAKGEIPGSPTIFYDHVQDGKAAGAPADWIPIQPVVANLGQVAVDAKAPHPYAAMLFIDYLLGDGQQVLKERHYVPATEQVSWDYWVPEQGKTAAQVEQDAKDWADLFKANFR